ncbi:MAG: hypothetical protein Q4D96_13980 [Propionibacteriaceae bacterium]|nr:hypothetical protein [Propionibacteriaceae bacterium]
MTLPSLSRRSLLAVAALAGTGALTGCESRPTEPSGWADGVPERPERVSKDTAVCDIRPVLPRPTLSPKGTLLFTAAGLTDVAGRSGAMLWDVAAERLLSDSLPGVGSHLTSFRNDDSLIDAVGAFVVHVDQARGTARHFGTGHTLFEPPCRGVTAITSVACSPIGKYVATAGLDGYVGIFDWASATRLTWAKVSSDERAMVHGFILDKLVVSVDGATVLLTMRGEEAFRFERTSHRPLVAGDTLLVANPEGGWDRIDPATGQRTSHLASQMPYSDALTPDGETLFTSPQDAVDGSLQPRPFHFTEVATGETREVTLTILTGGMVLLPDGRLLATTVEGIGVLDQATGQLQGHFATS